MWYAIGASRMTHRTEKRIIRGEVWQSKDRDLQHLDTDDWQLENEGDG